MDGQASPEHMLTQEMGNFRDAFSLLRTRRFGTFCAASFLSNIGTWAQQVAQPWLLLSLGASPFLIGIDAFAQGLPLWLLTLVGGVLADHRDRRTIIVRFQSAQMLCPLTLAALLLLHMVRPWMVITASLIVGLTDALSMPSFQAIVPSIVSRDKLPTALSLNATQFNLSRIAGPALAGILLTSIGATACYTANALSYIPFLMVALWILPRGMQHPNTDLDPRNPFEGARHVIANDALRSSLLTVLTNSVLCSPLITFTSVLVRQAFASDAARFSLTVAAFGVGGLLGALGLLLVNTKANRHYLSSGTGLIFALALLGISLNRWFLLLPLLMIIAGISMTMSNTSANTSLQEKVPDHLRGQAASLFMLGMRGGTALGALLTGISTSLLGVRHALLFNGLIALSLQLAIWQPWRPHKQDRH